MRGRLRLLALLAPLAACGARTGLFTPSPAPEPVVSFDAGGCREEPWLLFDFSDGSAQGTSGIYAMRADGSDGHLLDLPHGPGFFPSISRDGSTLLYATFLPLDADVDGGDDSVLYMYDLGTHTATPVVTTSQLTYSALSPDGQTVAYVSGFSLHDIAPDGTNDRTLLMGPNDQGTGYGHPTFAADPHTVLYGTGGIIGAIGIDGSDNQTLLAVIPGSLQYPNPAMSPDDTQLVMGGVCDQGLPDTLRVYPFASLPGASCESGEILAQVTQGASPNSANDPSWGPNGFIAYASGQDVWVIPATGGTPTNMTTGLTGDGGVISASDPVWAPACAILP
jgi:Tol biopolymer transport system component